MPRLRNRAGVVVSVSDDTATRLGPEWEPVEVEKPKPAPRRKTTKKNTDKS